MRSVQESVQETLDRFWIAGPGSLLPLRRSKRNMNVTYWMAAAAVLVPMAAMLVRRARRSAGRKTVAEVMIDNVVTVDASASLMEVAQRMREGNVGVLPVLEHGELRGIVTDRDLVVRGLARGVDPRTTRVAECATDQPVAARPDWSVDDAMRAMAGSRIGRLPVVDARNHVIGIVTLSSLALRSRNEDEALHTAQAVSRRSARSA